LRGHDGRGQGDPGPAGPGRHGDHREGEQGADDRAEQGVRGFPDTIGKRDFHDDELGEEEDEGELEDQRARQEGGDRAGEILGQQPHEAVENEEHRPGVEAGRRGEAERGQERDHRRNSRWSRPRFAGAASAGPPAWVSTAATGGGAGADFFSAALVTRSSSC
jgi:hypothetical protein